MNSIVRLMIIILVLIVAGTTIFLSTWDIPAPAVAVERVINNDRFSK